MTEEREVIRAKYTKDLVSSTRFGAWSLEKYENNAGYVVYHWVCGFWTHTFYNHMKNFCAHCLREPGLADYPEELENCYRIANFDLMTRQTYNASNRDQP